MTAVEVRLDLIMTSMIAHFMHFYEERMRPPVVFVQCSVHHTFMKSSTFMYIGFSVFELGSCVTMVDTKMMTLDDNKEMNKQRYEPGFGHEQLIEVQIHRFVLISVRGHEVSGDKNHGQHFVDQEISSHHLRTTPCYPPLKHLYATSGLYVRHRCLYAIIGSFLKNLPNSENFAGGSHTRMRTPHHRSLTLSHFGTLTVLALTLVSTSCFVCCSVLSQLLLSPPVLQ